MTVTQYDDHETTPPHYHHETMMWLQPQPSSDGNDAQCGDCPHSFSSSPGKPPAPSLHFFPLKSRCHVTNSDMAIRQWMRPTTDIVCCHLFHDLIPAFISQCPSPWLLFLIQNPGAMLPSLKLQPNSEWVFRPVPNTWVVFSCHTILRLSTHYMYPLK